MKAHRLLPEAHPELVEQWSEKNFPFLPEDETEGSYSKVWWKCSKCGTEWRAVVKNRAAKGTGCPCCAGKIVKKGYNDLMTLKPDVACQWSTKNLPLTPDQVTVGSSIEVWWQCEKGHEWKTAIVNRSKGNPCPICANEKLVPGVNDLATTHPFIAAEWSERNEISPEMIRASYQKQIWWKCSKCGNEYQAQPLTRVRNPNRLCPYCSGKKESNETLKPSPTAEILDEKDGEGG